MSNATASEPPPRRLERPPRRPRHHRRLRGPRAPLRHRRDARAPRSSPSSALLGGAGVILYVAATLLMPEEGQDQPLIRSGSRRGRGQLLVGAGLVAIGAANVLGGIGVGFHGHALWGSVMLAVGAFFLLRTQELRRGFSRTSDGATATIRRAPAAQPRDRVRDSAAAPGSRAATLIALGGVLLAAAAAIALVTALADDAGWEAVAGAAVDRRRRRAGRRARASAPRRCCSRRSARDRQRRSTLQASDVELRGGIGSRALSPGGRLPTCATSTGSAIGELYVDLRDTALPRGRTTIRATARRRRARRARAAERRRARRRPRRRRRGPAARRRARRHQRRRSASIAPGLRPPARS